MAHGAVRHGFAGQSGSEANRSARERDKQGDMSYHFRWIREGENGEQTIEENMFVDKDGKVYAAGGLKDYLGDAEIDLDGIMAENDGIEKGRLRGISEKADKKNGIETAKDV